jgi:hypothetical protein
MRPDARIEDVLLTLADPEEYVRGILEALSTRNSIGNEAVVRIGTSGSGVQPYYSIEEGEDAETITMPDGMMIRRYRHRVVFHGRSHKQILEDEFMGTSWSSVGETFAEVQSILGRLGVSKCGPGLN